MKSQKRVASMKKRKSMSSSSTAPVARDIRKGPVMPKGGFNQASGTMHLHRREFVMNLMSGTSGNDQIAAICHAVPGLDINPGNPVLFPWLSHIARPFERFKFHSLRLSFVPHQSATAYGRYYASVDYDYDDPVPRSKVEVLGMADYVDSAPWNGAELKCDPRRLMADMPWKYVWNGPKRAGVEPRTSFCGFFTVGFDTTVAHGYDVFVEYDVSLTIPEKTGEDTLYDSTGYPTGVTVLAHAGVTIPSNLVAVGDYVDFLDDFAPVTDLACPVKRVQCGAPGIPNVIYHHGGHTFPVPPGTLMLDLCNAIDGELSGYRFLNKGASSPSDIVNAIAPVGYWNLFDAAGAYLGAIDDGWNAVHTSSGGLSTASGAWAGAGTTLQSVVATTIGKLRETWPSVRFVLMGFAAAAQVAAANYQDGYRFKTEL